MCLLSSKSVLGPSIHRSYHNDETFFTTIFCIATCLLGPSLLVATVCVLRSCRALLIKPRRIYLRTANDSGLPTFDARRQVPSTKWKNTSEKQAFEITSVTAASCKEHYVEVGAEVVSMHASINQHPT